MHGVQAGEAIVLAEDGARVFTRPVRSAAAMSLEEVPAAFGALEAGLAEGLHAAGFVAYEAAPAFDSALACHAPGPLPLVCFGLYEGFTRMAAPERAAAGAYTLGPWSPGISAGAHAAALDRIRAYLAAGDSYQVNFTFPLQARFSGDPRAWFWQLCAAQWPSGPDAQRVYFDAGRFQILCASPELFFAREAAPGGGWRVRTRPMKGTRPRGRFQSEDQAIAAGLAASEKDRAENVMIVDMLRNDLGRIARTGSVAVEELFAIERYDTVWQMTSGVAALSDAGPAELFGALFPSASVTGAPKARTMAIIHELESHPRGVYCGAAGWWGPDGRARFNVGIRTATVDLAEGLARYPVGSGITWDSEAAAEYQECQDKAAVLRHARPEFALLETLLWEHGAYFLLAQHLERLAAAAAYFGRPVDLDAVRRALFAAAASAPERARVRLTVDAAGRPEAEAFALEAVMGNAPPAAVAIADAPLAADPVFIFHKTTHRGFYDDARAAHPGCADVLLRNDAGRVTEFTLGNLVVAHGGALLTPPLEDGLLPGVFRRTLLDSGAIREAPLSPADVRTAARVWLINSVRRWVPVRIA